MNNLTKPKKPAPGDWHPADIKAALEKCGYSLARLARAHGYCRGAAVLALRTPWPKMECIIGEAINVPANKIWPSRYHPDGTPRSGRGERMRKDITAPADGNVYVERAA